MTIEASSGTKQSDDAALMQRTAWAAVAVAGLLIVMKAVAFVITDSISMMASLADSGLDLFASAINLLAIRQALMPADREHRFGHGKAEPLAGLAQGAFIAGSATFLMIEAVSRFISPHPVGHAGFGLAVMGVSIASVFLLVSIQRYAVKRTGSVAIGADFVHYLGDLAVNLGVVVGILLAAELGWLAADPIVGLVVALGISVSAVHVIRRSYDQLMDHELPELDRNRIKSIVMGHDGVRSLHDLRTRAAGTATFIQLHIELDPGISLSRAHELSDRVEADILAAFPHSEVIIHQDPAGLEMPAALARS